MSINTHGLNLTNIEEASEATTDWPQGSGGYNQIAYNQNSGEIIVTEHVGDTWTEYGDPDIVRICDTTIHISAQRIADIIHNVIRHRAEEGAQ